MNERMECRGFVFLLCLLVANLQAMICCGFPYYYHQISFKLARLQHGGFYLVVWLKTRYLGV